MKKKANIYDTYMEIAKMEGSNKSTVMRSAKVALKKIQKKLAA